MTLTSIIRPALARRSAAAMALHDDIEASQRSALDYLLRQGRRTAWGAEHHLSDARSYEEMRQAVGVTPYEELRPWVMRMIDGERDMLWPGVTRRFAQSSGTSDGKSKYIPITDDSFKLNHYRGAALAVAHYLRNYKGSRIFDGSAFILGGSFSNELQGLRPGVKVGDLSANLIDNINPMVNLLRVPSKRIALMEDWSEKLPALAKAAVGRRGITNISGVPSWFLTVLKEVCRMAGKETVAEVWPRLEVFFHGGISMEPYREQYRELIGNDAGMRYWETYNASEGFFASQDDPAERGMSLMLGAGMFYEFEPLDGGEPLPAWEVEKGRVYSLILTGCNGLWRYPIGDTVRIESTSPLRITIAGRTKHYINAFGEELMVHNADAAIARACAKHGCSVANYTAAPLFTPGEKANGCHEWLVEFSSEPESLEGFADTLDAELQAVNSDYQAKRAGGIFLSRLRLRRAPAGLFDRWLGLTGKLGGQRKVPRLCNTRQFIDDMIKLCGEAR